MCQATQTFQLAPRTRSELVDILEVSTAELVDILEVSMTPFQAGI